VVKDGGAQNGLETGAASTRFTPGTAGVPLSPGIGIVGPAGCGETPVFLRRVVGENRPEPPHDHFMRQQSGRHFAERDVGGVNLPEQDAECIAERQELRESVCVCVCML
jgi:hypothetical protein